MENIDVTEWCQPGIFRRDCIATGRSLFGEGKVLLFDLQDFRANLQSGICENKEFLKDYETYGIDNFRFIAVLVSPELSNHEIRKAEL